MPIKTIEVPPEYHSYAQQLRRFLRREIRLIPKFWGITITCDTVTARLDDTELPIADVSLKLSPAMSARLGKFLNQQWIPFGDVQLRISTATPLLYLSSTSHREHHLTLPNIDVGVAGLPDPILTAIEPHAEGLLLHLTLRITRTSVTVLARFPVNAS